MGHGVFSAQNFLWIREGGLVQSFEGCTHTLRRLQRRAGALVEARLEASEVGVRDGGGGGGGRPGARGTSRSSSAAAILRRCR